MLISIADFGILNENLHPIFRSFEKKISRFMKLFIKNRFFRKKKKTWQLSILQ